MLIAQSVEGGAAAPSGSRLPRLALSVCLQTCRTQDDRKRCLRARPFLPEQIRVTAPDEQAQRQAEDHRVVELAGHREKIRDEVEREGEVDEHEPENSPAATGDPPVASEAGDDDGTVRAAAGERTSDP